MALSVYIPTSSEGGFPFLHTLSSTCCLSIFIVAILTGARRYLIVILICSCLIMSDVKHLFLLALRMSSLENCLFRSFAPFLIGLLVSLVLSCMSCLYILEINPLSVISFGIIFSLLRVSFHLVYSLLCRARAFKFN